MGSGAMSGSTANGQMPAKAKKPAKMHGNTTSGSMSNGSMSSGSMSNGPPPQDQSGQPH